MDARAAIPLDHSAHPDHGLYQQARAAVHGLDAHHGRLPDQRSDNLAAALAVAARRDGLSAIHRVVLSEDASTVFAVQGELHASSRQVSRVNTEQAVQTSVAQSSQAWERLAQSPATESPSVQPVSLQSSPAQRMAG